MLEKIIERMPKKTLLGLIEKGIKEGEQEIEKFLKKQLNEKGNRVSINIRLNKEEKIMVTLFDEGTHEIMHQSETIAPYLLGSGEKK